MNMILLTPWDLALAALLVLALAGTTFGLRLKMERQILVAAFRTAVQLLLLGLVLRVLFAQVNPFWVFLMALVMLLAGSREIVARQQRRFKGWWSFGLGASSMFISSFAVTILALLVIIGPEPWYSPQYAIPLLGMLMGNTMNGIALGMDRMTQTAWQQRTVIEQRLLLGQKAEEAILDIRRQATRTGLIPIVNSMSTAGLVSLPGMMTGQILAGSPPFEAVKYQILIMFLIAAGTGFGIMAALWQTSKRLFDDRQRLRLDNLVPVKGGR
ncbi:MAG: iron export ABC transporter permease subunit FetB [Proteobacteria bacterium]|nr:iron export ABC transporter permease subunit FetB [Pseudomonadota bacterium]